MYAKINRRVTHRMMVVTMALFIMLVTSYFTSKLSMAAEQTISVKEINYKNSTITLKLNSGDTEVYYSDSAKKTWQTIPGTIGADNTITFDTSWITNSRNYIITFKANSSTGILAVTLPKQITNFKANFNKAKGTITFSNTGAREIEWRKNNSTSWNTVNESTLANDISYLFNNGAVLYFRLAPVNGNSVTDTGNRASKEVSVTIPKKASAPAITIDGSKFNIAVKRGMSYCTVNADGTTSAWTDINSTSNLLLSNIAAKAMYKNSSTAQSEVTMQFQTNATSSSQVSKIATVTVPVQEGPPAEDTYGISLTNTSSTTASLQVKAASSKVPFEYTIVEKDNSLNYQTASWTSITSSTAVSLTNNKAPAGSHIYVRKKSIAADSANNINFALASVETDVTGSAGITYANPASTSTLTKLISTAGVCQAEKTSSYLTFSLYSPTSTTVSSISFQDAFGSTRGTATCKSTVTANSNSKSADDQYIITTKITSTSNIDSYTNENLYAKITLANSEVITSTPTTGVLLYLYPSTKLNNPVKGADDYETSYATSFKRVYLSKEAGDATSFKFRLDLGTAKIFDPSGIGTFTTEDVTISKIKYDNYVLTNGTDYTITRGSYVNGDSKTITTLTVTVNVNQFEGASVIDTTNTALPLEITLNNGETLDDDVMLTLVNTATLNDTPIAWTITEGSLKETKTSTVTNSDSTTSTVTEEVISYTLTLSIFDKTYAVAVSDVTWGGSSIFGSANLSNGKATIYLSNAKINKLTTNSTDTKNVVITLSNGFVINTGCKLTILNSK